MFIKSVLGPHKTLNLLSDGTGSPIFKTRCDSYPLCYSCVCVYFISFYFLVRKKIFVCDCMAGPEDSETPCLPQTSDCTKVTQTEIINCRINLELLSSRSTEESS